MTNAPWGNPPAFETTPWSWDDWLAPARRAGLALIVLGAILLVGGGCCGLATISFSRGGDAQAQFMAEFDQAGVSVEMVRTLLIAFTAAQVVAGLVLVVLGALVRGGSRWATIASIVLVGLMILGLLGVAGLGVVAALTEGATDPASILGLCMFVAPLALLVPALVMLIRASQANAALRAAQWQAWQQQQSTWGGPPPPPPGGPPLPPGA